MTILNLLCDIEGGTPIREARSCGGDAMIRVGTLAEANGDSICPVLISPLVVEIALLVTLRGR
jgi:hypothetical protein